ncbi:MAG: PAS domain-containing protein, partial [Acidobacteriota bacterium]|nr:PAS domain-containing protein [Acidobacteriota bacterium]
MIISKEQLELSEARFRQLFELSPAGILIVGADATIHRANPAMNRLLKAEDAKDLIGKSMFAFIAPEQREYCAACFGGITADVPSTVQVET